jgi:hypothetical protein
MRGAFNGQSLVVPGAAKSESKASVVNATRANVAQQDRPASCEQAHKSAAA